MTIRSPFKPAYGTNKLISPAVASAETTLAAKGPRTLCVINTGANIGYFRTGLHSDATVVATTADTPVPAGATRYFEIDPQHDTIATISATGTTFQVQQGEGGA